MADIRKCPKCNISFSINKPSSMITCPKCKVIMPADSFPKAPTKVIYCPDCNSSLTILADTTAKTVTCPSCQHSHAINDFSDSPRPQQQQQREQFQPKVLYCPCCNSPLSLVANSSSKVITCPTCKSTNARSKFSETPHQKKQQSHEETGRTGGSKDGKCYRPGGLMLIDDRDGKWLGDKSFSLHRGENTIGRQSPASRSSLQLPTTDSYMSKNHAIIDVIMKPDSTFEHRLSDNRSVNGTFINDNRLYPGDIAILQNGDIIRLGHTSLKFIIV